MTLLQLTLLNQKEDRSMNGPNFYKEFNKNLSVDNHYINHFMIEAMKMAKLAFDNDEVPVGAIVVNNGEIIGRGFNQVITKHSVSSHAEINAINQAKALSILLLIMIVLLLPFLKQRILIQIL